MKTKTNVGPTFAAIASCLLLVQADAATLVWTNLSGGNWNIAGNWSPNQVPGTGDNAIITDSGTYTVTLNANASVASLTLGGVGGTQTLLIPFPTLSLEAESSVIAGGLLELSGGTLSGTGMLTVRNVLNWKGGAMGGSGRTVIAPGATLNLANNTAVSLSTRTLENAGTVLCTGTGSLQGDPQAVVTNCPGALWEVRNDQTFTWIGGTFPRFDNAGTFRKSQSTGTATFSQFTFANYGTLEVQSGTLRFLAAFDQAGTARTANGTVLRLAGGGTASGPFDAGGGGLVDWTANYTLNPGAQLNGEGLYQVSSGTLTTGTNADVAARNLDLAGTLAGSGTLTVSNVLNWTGGAMGGSGRTVIAPGATLNLANNTAVSLSTRTLENAGTVLCTGTASLQGDPQAVVTNCAGGLWEVRNDQTFTWIGGSFPRFDNAGTFRKSQSTGTATFSQFTFANYGTLEVQSGTLRFLAAFDQAGTARTANGTVLRLAGGGTASGPFDAGGGGLVDWTANYTLNPGAQLNGEGLYQVSSGTLTTRTNADVPVRNLDLAGTLGVNGTLTVSNVLNWTGGAMSGDGRTVIAPGATLNLANNTAVSLSTRTLENAGTVLCTGTGNLQGDPQAVVTNCLGGLWEVRNDQIFTRIGGSFPRFDNAGIFRKSQSTGTATFSQFIFNNYGNLSVWQGSLYFATTLNLHPTGRIEFSLGGPDYPSGYGRVSTSPALQLDGCLVVTFRNGFVPGAGQHYDIISGPNQGTFQCYSAPTISPYVFINPAYQPNLVQLVTTDPTPTVSKLKMDAQKRFTMEIKGIASQNYAVVATTNLMEWTPLRTNTMPAATLWNFVDDDSPVFPCRFYRVIFVP